tara:strand:+ start:9525 stop:10097 length:573 start_codon:yes stop_codon:yes gene_type:complete
MAFLFLRKAHHTNKPLNFQLMAEPIDITVERNEMYDKLEYKIPAKNAGQPYKTAPSKDGKQYTINSGQEFELIASEALYKHLSIYDKNSLITVAMVPNDKGGISWDVEPMQKKELVQVNKPNHDLAIKWGMAFNNATRLVSNISTNETVKDKVELIEKIMPDMFKIACSMPEEPKKEEPKKEESEDDLPF